MRLMAKTDNLKMYGLLSIFLLDSYHLKQCWYYSKLVMESIEWQKGEKKLTSDRIGERRLWQIYFYFAEPNKGSSINFVGCCPTTNIAQDVFALDRHRFWISALYFWHHEWTGKTDWMAVNLMTIDRHIFKQSIYWASP